MPYRLHLRGVAWIYSRRKRLLDLALLVCLMPFAMCIALFSIIVSLPRHGRRVIIAQQRVGRHGHLFTIHKIRTMPYGKQYLTRTGELLAVLGADETPQLLYTIWSGKMALIGPRPLIPEDFPKMAAALAPNQYNQWRESYIHCRPGWMGAFSCESRLHLAQSPEYMLARYRCDTFYLKNACLRVDLAILLKSLTMWCTPPRRLWQALQRFTPSSK